MTDTREVPEEPTGWNGRERRSQGGRKSPGAAVSLNAWLALLFVGASLIALALVPLTTGRRIQALRSESAAILEPARDLTTELESVLASEMVAWQGFLFSGEPRFRQAYRAGQRREREIHDQLTILADSINLSIQQLRVDLYTLAFEWHEHHAAALDGLESRSSFMVRLPEDQLRYEHALTAAGELEEAVSVEVRSGQARMDAAFRRQMRLTVALVALALLSTGVVGVLARLLRRLAVVAEGRRAEAVRIRREIDAVLEATGDGVMGVDLDGHCTFLNWAGAALLGVSVRDALRRDVHELVHDRGALCSGASGECRLLALLEGREPARLLNEVFARSGAPPFPVQCEIRPMLDGRRARGLVLTFVDLTETREAAEALKQAVRARDEMVAVVSHDLRGPVGTINAAAQLLLEVPLPEDQWREHISAIERSSGRLSALIRDLLDVARIDAGVLAVSPVPERVDSLMDVAYLMAVPVARRKPVGLARIDSEEPEVRVRVDRERILQVFANLVDNAVRHTPEGGTVTLETRAETGHVRFAVRDTGPGIEPAAKDRIFDRYRQLKASSGSGTGLGLAIVRGIVEAHGGRVWVESEVGAGATFWFTLPVAGDRDGPDEPDEAESRAGVEVS